MQFMTSYVDGRGVSVPEDSHTRSIARFHRLLSKRGEVRRWRFEIIRGAARNVTFHSGDSTATIEVADREVQLTAPGGDAIALSEGDDVLIAARLGDPCRGSIYFNETKDTGSIDSAHKQALRMLTAGAAGALAAGAIVLTTILAARGDVHVSLLAVAHGALYLVSIAVSGVVFVLSCSLFALGLHLRKICALVRFVVEGE
jgi:hypothetical protein